MKNNAQKRESVQLDTERENAERTFLSSSRDPSQDMFNPLSMSKSERDGETTTTHGLEMRQANKPDGPERCADTMPTTAPLAGPLPPSDTTLTETPSTTIRQTSPSSAAVATCSTMEGSKPSQSWHESISQRLYETAGVRPYYSDDSCLIIHGDCREILPLLETGSIDLVLTDPPYGISLKSNGLRFLRSKPIYGDGDMELGQWLCEWSEEMGLPTIVFASPMKPWSGKWRQWLVWDKGEAVGGGGDPKTCWKQSWELIQVARTGVLGGKRDGAVLKYWMTPIDSIDHPAAKSLPLTKYLISKVEGQTILDPFMGSGTTLRAAKDLGRRAIGIEISEEYCSIAVKRLQQSVLPLGV